MDTSCDIEKSYCPCHEERVLRGERTQAAANGITVTPHCEIPIELPLRPVSVRADIVIQQFPPPRELLAFN